MVLAEVFKSIDQIIDREGQWVVFGAVAANLYRAEERTSFDVDVLVSISQDRFLGIAERAKKLGWQVRNVQSDWLFRFKHDALGELDMIRVEDNYQKQAMLRARATEFQGRDVYVLAPEDVIIHKMIANRPQDEADIISILRAEHALDWDYIHAHVKTWELEPTLACIEARYRDVYESPVPKIKVCQ